MRNRSLPIVSSSIRLMEIQSNRYSFYETSIMPMVFNVNLITKLSYRNLAIRRDGVKYFDFITNIDSWPYIQPSYLLQFTKKATNPFHFKAANSWISAMHVFPYFPRMRKGMITCLNYKDVHRNVFCHVYRTTKNIIFRIVWFSIHLWAKDGLLMYYIVVAVIYLTFCSGKVQ